jgi:hypothetical protein
MAGEGGGPDTFDETLSRALFSAHSLTLPRCAGDRQLAKFTRFALAVLEKENALTTYRRICEYVFLHRPRPFFTPLAPAFAPRRQDSETLQLVRARTRGRGETGQSTCDRSLRFAPRDRSRRNWSHWEPTSRFRLIDG